MASSPFVESLSTRWIHRKGTPVNVLFMGQPGSNHIALLNALAGRELLKSGNEPKQVQIREVLLSKAEGTKIFFTTVVIPASSSIDGDKVNCNALRRHLLHRRPASALVYLRHTQGQSNSEAVFLDSVEASLGKTLWQNAVCVTVTDGESGLSSELTIPSALVRPGYQPAGCFWDGTADSTENLAALLAEVVTNTLPFLPEPEARRDEDGEKLPAFGDLDLVSSNNMCLMFPSKSEQTPTKATNPAASDSGDVLDNNQLPHPPRAALPTDSGELINNTQLSYHRSGIKRMEETEDKPAFDRFDAHQPPMVPAFASLSLAFAPPVLHSPALLQSTKRNSTAVAAAPSALRGLSSVRASMPDFGSLKAGTLGLPGASASMSTPSLGKTPTNATAFPDMLRLPRNGPTFRTPSSCAGPARVVMVWFRNDMRVHDNEVLAAANRDGFSVLPVYCFDPRDYGKSSSGFDRTGPFRARFLLQCVSDLRKSLRARGSDLVVRVGHPEKELVSLAKTVGATSLYAHGEVTREDRTVEQRVAATLKDEGVESTYYWGSTLYHEEDLPFSLEDMPCNYGGFREAVKSLKVRQAIEAPKRMKQLPTRGNLNPGEIPSLTQLGLSTTGSASIVIKEPALVGGEGEALKRLSAFLAEAMALKPLPPARAGAATPNASSAPSTIGPCMLGATFSGKISPWLAMGCLSPRRMFEEMRAVLPSTTSAGASPSNAAPGSGGLAVSLDWIVFELLWRDFFRFITKKHASSQKGAPAPVAA